MLFAATQRFVSASFGVIVNGKARFAEVAKASRMPAEEVAPAKRTRTAVSVLDVGIELHVFLVAVRLDAEVFSVDRFQEGLPVDKLDPSGAVGIPIIEQRCVRTGTLVGQRGRG